MGLIRDLRVWNKFNFSYIWIDYKWNERVWKIFGL